MEDYSLLKYDEMFFEAERLIDERDIVQAVSLLEAIIEEQPDYGRAHNHLGWLYEHEYKDFSRSEKHYKAALTFVPDYPNVYLNYSILLSRLERLDDLKKLLDRAIHVIGIKKAEVFYEYGILYEMKGDFGVAFEYYKKAIFHSLINKDIETYNDAISRCSLKISLLEMEDEPQDPQGL